MSAYVFAQLEPAEMGCVMFLRYHQYIDELDKPVKSIHAPHVMHLKFHDDIVAIG